MESAPCYGPWKMPCLNENWQGPDCFCEPNNVSEDVPFYNAQGNGNNVYWASNLLSHNGDFKPLNNGYNPDGGETNITGEYVGIDFMLLHNLFLLTHSNQIPSNFRNMMDAVVDYEIPFTYTKGDFSELLGSKSHHTPFKCYGFNSLDVHDAILSSDANVYFRTKSNIILGSNVYCPAGSNVYFNSGYDAYDCDDIFGTIELRIENVNDTVNENSNFTPHNSNPLNVFSNYNIHPNPNNGYFVISQNREGYVNRWQLLTLMGQHIISKDVPSNISEFEIDVSPYPKGIYLLQLETKDGIKAERIVFQ